jgi:hypothetical protein
LPKVGYFYILKNIVLGEAVNPNNSTIYEGHAAFWESESIKFFSHSSAIDDIRLCWYGCERGRITFFEGQFQFFGTHEVINYKDCILTLFSFNIDSPLVITRPDDHYQVDVFDKKIIDQNIKYLNIPKEYPYFIGLIN